MSDEVELEAPNFLSCEIYEMVLKPLHLLSKVVELRVRMKELCRAVRLVKSLISPWHQPKQLNVLWRVFD
jgi:hypothetical protein